MRIFVLTASYELRVSRKSHLRDHPMWTWCSCLWYVAAVVMITLQLLWKWCCCMWICWSCCNDPVAAALDMLQHDSSCDYISVAVNILQLLGICNSSCEHAEVAANMLLLLWTCCSCCDHVAAAVNTLHCWHMLQLLNMLRLFSSCRCCCYHVAVALNILQLL